MNTFRIAVLLLLFFWTNELWRYHLLQNWGDISFLQEVFNVIRID